MNPKMNENKQDVCASCGASPSGAELSRCGDCKKVGYCNKECQRKGWKEHKKACKYSTELKAAKTPKTGKPDPLQGMTGFPALFNHELANFIEHQRAMLSEVLSQAIIQSSNPRLDGKDNFVILLAKYNPTSGKMASRFIIYDGFIKTKAEAWAFIDPTNEAMDKRAGIEAQCVEAAKMGFGIAFCFVVCMPELHEYLEGPLSHCHRIKYRNPETAGAFLATGPPCPVGWLEMARLMTAQGMVMECDRPYKKFTSATEQ